MSEKVVTRFAPSPTGFLHVGGARTALFNYLYSRKHNGIMRLRIEDTDRRRSSDEMVRRIFDGLAWLGIHWETPVVHQGDNAALHREVAGLLLNKKEAYRCFCSRESLEAKRKRAEAEKNDYRYDGTCRNLSQEEIQNRLDAGQSFSVRFRVPEGKTSWEDGVHNTITIDNSELDDFIILRSDGSPVYQLAVVADDHEMGITDVIRGDDHISNTPKQILLYQAMDWPVPRFTHVPLILGPDKKRLSKRHGSTAVEDYRERGFLPEAMFNFLALLGWNPGDEREIMPREELAAAFSLEGISKKSAVFDEQKLEWMNSRYLMQKTAAELLKTVVPLWRQAGFIPETVSENLEHTYLRIIELHKPRAKVLTDFVEPCRFYFEPPESYDPKGVKKHLKNPEVWNWLRNCITRLAKIDKFRDDIIEQAVRNLAGASDISAGKLIHPLRLALTGRTASPGLFEIMEILGRDTVLHRLRGFLEKKETLSPDTGLNE